MAFECRGRFKVTSKYPPLVPARARRSTRIGSVVASDSSEGGEEGGDMAEEDKEC